MSIRWSDVVSGAPAPGLASLSVDAQDSILETVAETVNASAFGGGESARCRRACILLAAYHGQVVVDAAEGVAGPVTSKSADGLSKSYAVAGAANDASMLALNGFGRAYLALVRTSSARIGAVL